MDKMPWVIFLMLVSCCIAFMHLIVMFLNGMFPNKWLDLLAGVLLGTIATISLVAIMLVSW